MLPSNGCIFLLNGTTCNRLRPQVSLRKAKVSKLGKARKNAISFFRRVNFEFADRQLKAGAIASILRGRNGFVPQTRLNVFTIFEVYYSSKIVNTLTECSLVILCQRFCARDFVPETRLIVFKNTVSLVSVYDL